MMVWSGRLPGAMALGWPGVGAEHRAAAVQQHAAFGRQDAAAELVEQRVDEGDRVAVAVDDAEIDRVLVLALVIDRRGAGAVEADLLARALELRI